MVNALDLKAERRVVRKILWRIIPFSTLLFIFAFLDRVNLGYAALQMNQELGLSTEAFGFAAGVFFFGNTFFEVPSNLMLVRFGPRKWIARIIVTWGIIAALTAFVQNATQLHILRFLLGVAEAGFIPGMVAYFTLWIRQEERAFALGLFLTAMPITYVLGGPLSTAIMQYVHFYGISGWRWMLFLEGLPAILGGIACFFLLNDSPQKAKWLTADEKAWLAQQFEKELRHTPDAKTLTIRQVFFDPAILFLSLIYFLSQVGGLGIGYWLPLIIRNMSSTASLSQIGLLSAIPYALAAIGLVVWGRISDKLQERRWCTVIALVIGAAGLYSAGSASTPLAGLVWISIAMIGIFTSKPTFFAILNQVVSRPSVPLASAVITSIGNLGGFFGPYIVGVVSKGSPNSSNGLYVLSGALLIAAFSTLLITKPKIDPGTGSEAHYMHN